MSKSADIKASSFINLTFQCRECRDVYTKEEAAQLRGARFLGHKWMCSRECATSHKVSNKPQGRFVQDDMM